MSELVADCPRCDSKNMTFDLLSQQFRDQKYNWQNNYEVFCVCRHCSKSMIFHVSQREPRDAMLLRTPLSEFGTGVNDYVKVEGFISLKDYSDEKPPEYLNPEIEAIYNEGTTCLSVNCYNAAGSMFRLCLDLATKDLLPKEEIDGLSNKVRRSLGLRLEWLFASKLLPSGLEELSTCIKDDGNDGAHDGTLTEPDARDLLDFTYALLEKIYTEPEKLAAAKERRTKRRTAPD